MRNWFEEVRGEYWIDDSGQERGADGDYNHEGIVLDLVLSEIADEVNFQFKYDTPDQDALMAYVDENGLEGQITPVLLQVLSGQIDARIYAMQYWGWKTVRGNNIETWNASPEDLKTIARGLWEVDSDGDDASETFYVYAYATGKSHEFTLAELEAGGVMQQPSQVNISRIKQGWNNIAANQVADLDKGKMNPYYQQKQFPFGDHLTFKGFLALSEENRESA